MMYANKGNIQVKIDDDQAEAYAKQGYRILDKEGNEVAGLYHAPVPYHEHIAKVQELEARIKELEALKESETDDFQ